MNKEFVKYEEALALKELGFDNVPCMGVYYDVTNIEDIDINSEEHFSLSNYETQYYANKGYKDAVLAPLYQQAFRWFRENFKDNIGELNTSITYISMQGYFYTIFAKHKKGNVTDLTPRNKRGYYDKSTLNFQTYEEAELACLKKLIEIVKKTS